MTDKEKMMEGQAEPPHVNPTLEEIINCDRFIAHWPDEIKERINEWGTLHILQADLALRMGAKVTIIN